MPSLWAKREGGILFMDWGIAVSPSWSGHTHTHAGTHTGRVSGMAKCWQPTFSLMRGATSDLGGIPAVWALMETTGHFSSPLLGTAPSKQRCEIQQVGYTAASMRYLSCYELPFFFFSWGKILSLFFFINLIRYNLSQLFSAVFVYFHIRTDTGQLV